MGKIDALPDQNLGKSPGMSEQRGSRRIYVYWGIALTLLLAAGLSCWAVVVPVLEVRRVVGSDGLRRAVYDGDNVKLTPYARGLVLETLGGRERASGKLRVYLHMPNCVAPNKPMAAYLLSYSGAADGAASALKKIRAAQEKAQ